MQAAAAGQLCRRLIVDRQHLGQWLSLNGSDKRIAGVARIIFGQNSECALDPPFMLCLGPPQTGSREVPRLVIDLLVV